MKHLRILFFTAALVVFAGCQMLMKERELASIALEGGGLVKLVSLHRGPEGRQVFALQSVPQKNGQMVNKGLYVSISSEAEGRILKQIDLLEKAVAKGEFQASAPEGEPFAFQVQIPGKKPRAFIVRTNIGADPRVTLLMKWLNEEIPEGYEIRVQ